MAKKVLHTAVAVIGIAAASGAAWWYQNQPSNGPKDPAAAGAPSPGASASAAPGTGGPQRPPAVEVGRVEVIKLVDNAQAVGTLRSRQSVVLRPEVSGRISGIHFKDGERVKRGQLLVQLDDQLQVAQLKQSQAELSIARANHRRNQDLVAQNFISQRSVDESAANLEVAEAKLALAQATVARLRIVAPFDGIAGIRGVNVGDYLKDGADIVNIEDLEAVYVDFRLPERYQTKLSVGQTALVDLDALPGRRYPAVVQAIDPLLDANGRSVGLRGCIDNRHLQLRPGMFAKITTVFGERDNARVVPEEALVPQGGRQFVIKLSDGPDADTKTAQRVDVKVGLRQPGRVEILDGLEPGDLVVTAGQQRVQRDGMAVRVVQVGAGGPGGPRGAASGPAGAASVAASAASAASAAGPAASAPALPASASASGAGRPGGPGGAGGSAPGGRAAAPVLVPPMPGPNPCGATVARAPATGASAPGARTDARPGARPAGAAPRAASGA